MIEGISGAIAVGLSAALGVASDRTTKKRKQAFWDQYGSYEGFRSQVDEERIREVWRERGDLAAMKAVRDAFPYVPLPVAKRYVDELPA
ncbi:hypothetical protein [Streptomyces sp. NPDC006193]|uniref:hypothetical protein n=1 Tax=Streptomyces sp. NPDC006193 TaxID=3155717 RepID=UPI0033A6E33E